MKYLTVSIKGYTKVYDDEPPEAEMRFEKLFPNGKRITPTILGENIRLISDADCGDVKEEPDEEDEDYQDFLDGTDESWYYNPFASILTDSCRNGPCVICKQGENGDFQSLSESEIKTIKGYRKYGRLIGKGLMYMLIPMGCDAALEMGEEQAERLECSRTVGGPLPDALTVCQSIGNIPSGWIVDREDGKICFRKEHLTELLRAIYPEQSFSKSGTLFDSVRNRAYPYRDILNFTEGPYLWLRTWKESDMEDIL